MQYSTHSKKEVLALFNANPSSSFTLGDIISSLDDIPKSSVYRIVDSLEKDGLIRSVGFGVKRAELYQLSDRNACPRHMHIRCTVCGRTVHIDEETSNLIEEILESRLGFKGCLSTVFTGICPACSIEENK